MDDRSRFCCSNSEGPDHGNRGAGNLTAPHRYGPGKSRRMLRCRTRKARSSGHKGPPLFDARFPDARPGSVLERIAEGCGVRQAGRLCEVDRGAVGRCGRLAGAHAVAAHDELMAISPVTMGLRFDEECSLVAEKEANCDRSDPADDHEGDSWDHVAYDPEHRPILGVVPGARTVEDTEILV